MTTYDRIKELCEKEGFAISSIPQKIPGISINKASITGWKNGSVPRPDKLKAIADYFGVSIAYLKGEEEAEPAALPLTVNFDGNILTLSKQETELLSIFQKLSVIDQAKLLIQAEDMLNKG